MRTRLRVALAAQLVFFAAWGGWLLTSHRAAGTVWLETGPVDPRDLLSGHYVALRYPIASPEGDGCEVVAERAPRTVWVRLAPGGRHVATRNGEVEIWEATACRLERPIVAAGEVWLAGEVRAGRGTVTYGIERFYVPETSALRTVTSGQVVAQVAVNEAGWPRLVDLVRLQPAPGAG